MIRQTKELENSYSTEIVFVKLVDIRFVYSSAPFIPTSKPIEI